jgi:hypothetical protein
MLKRFAIALGVLLLGGAGWLLLGNRPILDSIAESPGESERTSHFVSGPDPGVLKGAPEVTPEREPTRERVAQASSARNTTVWPERLPRGTHPAKQTFYKTNLSALKYMTGYLQNKRYLSNRDRRRLAEGTALVELALQDRYYFFKPKEGGIIPPTATEDAKYFTTAMHGMWIAFEVKRSEYPEAFLPLDPQEERLKRLAEEKRRARKQRRTR